MNAVFTGKEKSRSYSGDYMERGKKAEEIVLEWLKTRPYVLGLEDFRELRAVQKADVDVLIETIDGRVVLAEIKSDSYLGSTGNVLYEVLRLNHTCQPDKGATLGWSARTPAKYILFYASSQHKIYRFDTDKYRAAFQRYTQQARKGTRFDFVETDNIKSTLNVLIPISYLEGAYIVYDLNQQEEPPF